jgi:hypothetical protein
MKKHSEEQRRVFVWRTEHWLFRAFAIKVPGEEIAHEREELYGEW